MKVAIIGGTGFVGTYIVEALLERDHQPVLLVRPGSEGKVAYREQCTLVPGKVQDVEALRHTLEGCDAAIYNIGILREFKSKGITFEELQYRGAARTMDVAVKTGVKRFLLMSANGVKADGTAYQTTKYRAEQHVKATELDWTIFRPSVMFGDPRGKMEFCTQLQQQLINPPLPAPLFYEGLLPLDAGSFLMAPIHVKDVATAFSKSLTMPETVHQTYGLCGPETFDWKTIIQILAKASGKHKLALPVPAFMVKSAAAMLDQFEFFPLSQEQLTMLLEGNACDSSEAFRLFEITPTPFNENSLSYLSRD